MLIYAAIGCLIIATVAIFMGLSRLFRGRMGKAAALLVLGFYLIIFSLGFTFFALTNEQLFSWTERLFNLIVAGFLVVAVLPITYYAIDWFSARSAEMIKTSQLVRKRRTFALKKRLELTEGKMKTRLKEKRTEIDALQREVRELTNQREATDQERQYLNKRVQTLGNQKRFLENANARTEYKVIKRQETIEKMRKTWKPKPQPEHRSKRFTVSATAEQFEKLNKLKIATGAKSLSAIVVDTALEKRQSVLTKEEKLLARDSVIQLKAIGNNINQAVVLARKDGLKGEQVEAMTAKLDEVLSIAKQLRRVYI